MPTEIIKNKSLTPIAKILYAILLDKIDNNNITMATAQELAEETGSSERSVYRAIEQLKKYGYIKRTEPTGRNTLFDIYEILPKKRRKYEKE